LLADKRVDLVWPDSGEFGTPEFFVGVGSNEEAAKQAVCRYIFGLEDLHGCFTIIVESDGSISLAEAL
jgi:hypothetical protein